MNGEVDGLGGEGVLNLLCEHALGADLGKGDVEDFVAGGFDDSDVGGVAGLAQRVGDVIGLPERELRAARADAEMRHQDLMLSCVDLFGGDTLFADWSS